jgi:RecB family endonuclease NucS
MSGLINLEMLISSILGGFVVVVITIIGLVIFIYLDDRRRERPEREKQSPPYIFIPEATLETQIIDRFKDLFPGWRIYDDGGVVGSQFHTDIGRIDILAIDKNDNLVVIELKKRKAADQTAAQLDRYITWVQRNLAEKHQQVRGIIIATDFDHKLDHIVQQRKNVELMRYRWSVELSGK